MGITAKELAKKLNLSETAISMALNNKPGVSRDTRKLVIAEAERLGYDFSRLSIKKNHGGNIYCIIYHSHNAILNYSPIFSELTDGIEMECRVHDYRMRTLQIYDRNDDLDYFIEDLRIADCAGIILLGTEITEDICRKFLTLSLPIILLDSYFPSIDTSSVLINNTQGAFLATSYLIDRTGKQPGHLCSSYKIENFKERMDGFKQALRVHGMAAGKSPSYELAPSIEGAFSDMLELINSRIPLSECYFADNDLIAIGAIKALKLRGYHIPDDIAIIGFDNISEGRILEPALTTIDIPRRYMGSVAARQLIFQITTPVPHTVKIEVSTSLVKRFSV